MILQFFCLFLSNSKLNPFYFDLVILTKKIFLIPLTNSKIKDIFNQKGNTFSQKIRYLFILNKTNYFVFI